MPSIEEAGAAGWGPFFFMWEPYLMPHWLSVVLAVGLVVVNFLCVLAGLTSCSRMMFAFARDGGLPASETLSHVSAIYRTAHVCHLGISVFGTVYAPYYLFLAVA